GYIHPPRSGWAARPLTPSLSVECRLLRDALGDAHEDVLQVDLLFLEQLQAVAVLDQHLREEATVLDALGQRHLEEVLLLVRLDGGDGRVLGDDLPYLVVLALADGDLEDGALAHLADSRLHVAVEKELAAFDDADLVADVGQFGEDVTGDQDG